MIKNLFDKIFFMSLTRENHGPCARHEARGFRS